MRVAADEKLQAIERLDASLDEPDAVEALAAITGESDAAVEQPEA